MMTLTGSQKLIELDVFILGGEFSVLLDAGEWGQGELQIASFL